MPSKHEDISASAVILEPVQVERFLLFLSGLPDNINGFQLVARKKHLSKLFQLFSPHSRLGYLPWHLRGSSLSTLGLIKEASCPHSSRIRPDSRS